MVRPFTLRDLALVRRLSEKGVSLHAESALAENLHPLRGALLSMVARGDCPTLIWKSENKDLAGFIQLLMDEDRQHAHILYLSPNAVTPINEEEVGTDHSVDGNMHSNEGLWLSLLDQAVSEAGHYGIHSLVAEVDEIGPELAILRRAGFAVYTRQDIWSLAADKSIPEEVSAIHKLRPRLEKDDWDLQLLYANTVPRLVQLVEPTPPMATRNTWVQRDESGELVAFVQIRDGEIATWIRLFIHPSVESDAEEILKSALFVKTGGREKPVYLCVRRYEGWLPAVLERVGFEKWGSQAVMVKHTVYHTRREMPKPAVGLNNTGLPVSTPYSRNYASNLIEYSGSYLGESGAHEPEQNQVLPVTKT
jgi:hypothetical protein